MIWCHRTVFARWLISPPGDVFTSSSVLCINERQARVHLKDSGHISVTWRTWSLPFWKRLGVLWHHWFSIQGFGKEDGSYLELLNHMATWKIYKLTSRYCADLLHLNLSIRNGPVFDLFIDWFYSLSVEIPSLKSVHTQDNHFLYSRPLVLRRNNPTISVCDLCCSSSQTD